MSTISFDREQTASSLPLGFAEPHLLQILLSRFELERIDTGQVPGIHLVAEFDNHTEAIWLRQQRRAIQNSITNFDSMARDLDESERERVLHEARDAVDLDEPVEVPWLYLVFERDA